MTLNELPDVLTVDEAAAFLRISRGTAYELCRQGRIPTVRLGRRVLVPKGALAAVLGQLQGANPAPIQEPPARPVFCMPVTKKRRRFVIPR